MKSVKRKGFTLVELLIVIVIIGILAGSMMMLMGSSTDKAEATKIISDIRTLKGAALQYYADKSGYPATGDVEDLGAYVDKDLSSGYSWLSGSGASADTYFVGRIVPNTGALEKLLEAVRNDGSNKNWLGTETALSTLITDSDPATTPTVASPTSTTYFYSQVN
jgi:general secretion pathway protein G